MLIVLGNLPKLINSATIRQKFFYPSMITAISGSGLYISVIRRLVFNDRYIEVECGINKKFRR